MKITRKTLLIITAGLGILLVSYGIISYFTGFSLGEPGDKYFANTIIITALILFLYNRKMPREEKQTKEAAEKDEEPDNENLPRNDEPK